MIYIEYYSRRPGVPLGEFHRNVIAGQEGWASAHPEDRLVWSAARTWRMGPEPEYVGVWWTPASGFERIDEWDAIFQSGEASGLEDPFQQVARIDAAGCYDALIDPVPANGGTYYAEFFRLADGDVRDAAVFFQDRARKRRPSFSLNLLMHRIGRLGPEPGGLAVWSVPDFGSLREIATDLGGPTSPVEIVAAGTYADIGREIL